MGRTFFSKKFLGPCPAKDLERQLPSQNFKITKWSTKDLAPHVGSLSLPRWAQGPLLVHYRPGTPTYKLQVKTRSVTGIHVPPRDL
jgi:hypothetical protein